MDEYFKSLSDCINNIKNISTHLSILDENTKLHIIKTITKSMINNICDKSSENQQDIKYTQRELEMIKMTEPEQKEIDNYKKYTKNMMIDTVDKPLIDVKNIKDPASYMEYHTKEINDKHKEYIKNRKNGIHGERLKNEHEINSNNYVIVFDNKRQPNLNKSDVNSSILDTEIKSDIIQENSVNQENNLYFNLSQNQAIIKFLETDKYVNEKIEYFSRDFEREAMLRFLETGERSIPLKQLTEEKYDDEKVKAFLISSEYLESRDKYKTLTDKKDF